MEKGKNIAVVLSFFLVLFGFLTVFLVSEDQALSFTERRKLAALPEITVQGVFSGEFMTESETYMLDQFPARELFRKLKAHLTFDVLRQKDNKGIYLVDDGVYKLEYPLNEDQVFLGAKKINRLYDTYLSGMNVYYAVIPDKNYFASARHGYPALDYDRMKAILGSEIRNVQEIELFDCLTKEDYYLTDPHWKQEKLDRVVNRISQALNIELPGIDHYTVKSFAPFYGAYYGQSALAVQPDEIHYLSSLTLEEASLYNLEKNEFSSIYTPEKYDGMDGYDLFLSGTAAYLVMENKNETSGRELVIFRDSFGSSLAPLLLEGYAKITLIDLRYMSSDLLPQLITFADQDVLFLYSTLVFNNSAMLR